MARPLDVYGAAVEVETCRDVDRILRYLTPNERHVLALCGRWVVRALEGHTDEGTTEVVRLARLIVRMGAVRSICIAPGEILETPYSKLPGWPVIEAGSEFPTAHLAQGAEPIRWSFKANTRAHFAPRVRGEGDSESRAGIETDAEEVVTGVAQ